MKKLSYIIIIVIITLFFVQESFGQQLQYNFNFPERLGITTPFGIQMNQLINDEKVHNVSLNCNLLSFDNETKAGEDYPMVFSALAEFNPSKSSSRRFSIWKIITAIQFQKINVYQSINVRAGVSRLLTKSRRNRYLPEFWLGFGFNYNNVSLDLNNVYFRNIDDSFLKNKLYQRTYFAPFVNVTYKQHLSQDMVLFGGMSLSSFLFHNLKTNTLLNANLGFSYLSNSDVRFSAEVNLIQSLQFNSYVLLSTKIHLPLEKMFSNNGLLSEASLIPGLQYGTNKVFSSSLFLNMGNRNVLPFGIGVIANFFNPLIMTNIPLLDFKIYFHF